MREAKVNKSELARRLDWHMPQVDRVLDVHHASQLDQLDAAFGAFGETFARDRPLPRQRRQVRIVRDDRHPPATLPRQFWTHRPRQAMPGSCVVDPPGDHHARVRRSGFVRLLANRQWQTHCPAPTWLPSHDYHSGGSPVLGFNRRDDIRSAGSHPDQRHSDDGGAGFRVGVALPFGLRLRIDQSRRD